MRSRTGLDRLEAMLLVSIEKDILLKLDDAEIMARFANKAKRQTYSTRDSDSSPVFRDLDSSL
jgi:hypothetical protein